MNRRTKWMRNTKNLIECLQIELKTKNEIIKQLQATTKISGEEKNTRLIEMVNKALGLVYDTTHPMPKVEISQILSKIKTILSEESNPTEFTKECQEMIKTPDDDKGWTELAGYTIWLEVKLEQACRIIDQLQINNNQQESKLRKDK